MVLNQSFEKKIGKFKESGIPMILEFVLVCQPSTVLGINDNVKH